MLFFLKKKKATLIRTYYFTITKKIITLKRVCKFPYNFYVYHVIASQAITKKYIKVCFFQSTTVAINKMDMDMDMDMDVNQQCLYVSCVTILFIETKIRCC